MTINQTDPASRRENDRFTLLTAKIPPNRFVQIDRQPRAAL
jgi:hypothetical protein